MSISKYISRQFSNPSGLGGKIVSFVINRHNTEMYEETARILNIDKSDRVLDIGCGNGYMLNFLAKRLSATFDGVDISESILNSAKKRNRKFVQNGTMSFSVGVADKMPFKDSTFDKIYTLNTVYFWDDLNATMQEIRRTMKPRGLFVNTLFTNEALSRFPHTKHGYRFFAEEQLIEAARDSGFDVSAVPIMNNAAYCIVCRLS